MCLVPASGYRHSLSLTIYASKVSRELSKEELALIISNTRNWKIEYETV